MASCLSIHVNQILPKSEHIRSQIHSYIGNANKSQCTKPPRNYSYMQTYFPWWHMQKPIEFRVSTHTGTHTLSLTKKHIHTHAGSCGHGSIRITICSSTSAGHSGRCTGPRYGGTLHKWLPRHRQDAECALWATGRRERGASTRCACDEEKDTERRRAAHYIRLGIRTRIMRC
jgi:hypothetical protein